MLVYAYLKIFVNFYLPLFIFYTLKFKTAAKATLVNLCLDKEKINLLNASKKDICQE